MAINFDTSPYYDDYNEDKGFYRILFKPGVSVQARELTQLQTTLQKQVERVGLHFFKEGSRVFGGEFGYTNEFHSVKLTSVFGTDTVDDYIDQLTNIDIIGETSGIQANVVAYTKSTDTDAPTLFVTYTTTGNDKESKTFTAGENLIARFDSINEIEAGYPILTVSATNPTAIGQSASIERGVYFIKGHFVLVDTQRIILSKYTNGESARIGLSITESIISASEDESLLDNAQGSPNFSARGADRYFIGLDLKALSLDSTADENFVELQRIVNGRQVQSPDQATNQFTEKERQAARQLNEIEGDFIIDEFDVDLRETLNDGTNNGLFVSGSTTDSGNTPSDDLLTLQISSGIAYVSGYRVETIAPTFIDINKPRNYTEFTGASTPVEVGNYVHISNMYNTPDITSSDPAIKVFNQVDLYDSFTTTPGQANGQKIGVARIRGLEFASGDDSNLVDVLGSDSVFRAFMFDIKMFTHLTLNDTMEVTHIAQGTLITGSTSGAYGYVNSVSSGTELYLTSVTGQFVSGEQLISSASYETGNRLTNAGLTALTISSFKTYSMDQSKQLFMDDPDAGQDFTSDLRMEVNFGLSGTANITGTAVTGLNSAFLSELRTGDQLLLPTGTNGTIETRYVSTLTSDTQLILDSAVTTDVSSVGMTRARAYINDQEKNLSIRKLAKDWVRTLKIDSNSNQSNTSVEFRRQFIGTTGSDGIVTFNAGANQSFNAESNLDFQISVLIPGAGGSAVAGDIINVKSSAITITGDGTNALTVDSASLFGNGAQIKLNATMNKTAVDSKTKTIERSAKVKVINKKAWTDTDGPMVYGTSAHHRDISLGVSDAYSIIGVYDSGTPGVDPSVPSLELSDVLSTFVKGEYIRGQSSGAIGIVVTTTSPMEYVSYNDVPFTVNEQILGEQTGASATIDTLIAGNQNIVNKFLLDSGQRDNFYDIARLIIKPKSDKPAGDLLVVFDYFTHGSGDFFTIDSYSGVDYKEIPTYSATRIDPEVRNADGLYDLRSAVDFRPRVANPSRTVDGNGVITVTGTSFDFESRKYTGSGSSKVDAVKDNANFEYDFDYYLARNSSLFVTGNGVFNVVDGKDSENPQTPKAVSNSMRIADIEMPPYVIDIDDIVVNEYKTKRYTMKDIGMLETRLNNVEYNTALSMLEKDAETMQIKDSYGLDRFKSGILVDNFGGHKVGDTVHQDYRCAIDMTNRILRPKFSMKSVNLIEKALNDTERLAAGYQVTGDIATLPYEHVVSIEQNYATRVENLNPVLSFFWEGSMKMIPSSDEWFEQTYLPHIRVNVEGNYNTLLQERKNQLGTVWDAPVTSWTGVTTNRRGTGSRIFEQTFANFVRGRGRRVLQRVVSDEIGIRRQSGIQTSIVEQIDYKTTSNRIVARSLIPYMREKDIYFAASGLKPFTQVYPFFDNVDVSKYCNQVTGSIAAADGANTTRSQTADWNSISKVEIYYDNNRNAAVTMRADFARDTDAEYGQANVTEYWRYAGQQNTPAVRSTNYSVITLTPTYTPVPNAKGELYFRLLMRPVDIPSLDRHQIQISEIVFYDQDNNIISNADNVEVYYSRNFVSPQNVCDGTGELEANPKAPGGIGINGVNYNSDRSLASEAYVLDRNRNSNVYWDYRIYLRIVGGAFTIPSTSGNVRFIRNEDIKPGTFITDASGSVAGVFSIPDPKITGNPKFQTGTRELRLSSSPTNATEGVDTFATSDFTSTGIMNTRQATITATRNARIERQRVSRTTRVTRAVDAGLQQVGWYDPLAQSILPSTEGGEFITKVDVYFSQKDGVIPVSMQIRTMENGTPTTTILPGAEVTLNPEDVNVSNDGTVATTFTFDVPVYVKENEEIAIVLISNSQKYLVWISRLGEEDPATGRYVSEQPYLGVLFKSQNNSTWTAYDLEDLKFKVYRAKFDTNITGVVELNNDAVPLARLDNNPIIMTAGSNIVKVLHDEHGMYGSNNYVSIKGVSNDITSTLAADISDSDNVMTLSSYTAEWPTSGDHTFMIESAIRDEANYEVVSGTVTVESGDVYTISGLTRGVDGSQVGSHEAGITVHFYELNGIPLNEINTTKLVSNQSMDYYTITTTAVAIEDAVVGGANATATQNAMADAYQIMVPTIEFPGTSIETTAKMVTSTSPSGSQPSFVSTGEKDTIEVERIISEFPQMICSETNEVERLASTKSGTIKFYLNSTKDNLSPYVDLERMSIACHTNRIDNVKSSSDVYPAGTYVAPTAPDGDSSESVYITKRVQLKTPATAIRVYLDAVRNTSAEIQVMYKVLRSDDSTDFDEIGWTYFNSTGTSDDPVSPVANRTSFLEYSYTENDIPEFISFAIKIKMNGTDSTEVPLIKDLRAIALAV